MLITRELILEGLSRPSCWNKKLGIPGKDCHYKNNKEAEEFKLIVENARKARTEKKKTKTKKKTKRSSLKSCKVQDKFKGKEGYRRYLKSPWWKSKRTQKMDSVLWKCEECGMKAEQVHHIHYNSRGREKNTDLQALCENCHKKKHGLL